MKKKIFFIIILIIFILCLSLTLYYLYPKKTYTNKDFNIDTYISNIDMDNDGIDDQSDILINAKKYISTKPKYKSKYYSGGYSNDSYGVCTDVVAYALKESGYDLKELVNEDINNNKDLYKIKTIDKNIDFRRVTNLKIYFNNTAISLTTDINEIDKWQGGDIIIFKKHIGIISDKRNKEGIPYLIHHAYPYQLNYEEDILSKRNDIIGHYRIS